MTCHLVSVDIGGTHARFAIATVTGGGTITLGEPETLYIEDHASFQAAWEEFRARQGGYLPHAVAMAIAGRADDKIIRFTNNPWTIHRARLCDALDVDSFAVVNDFEAVGHAVACLDADRFVHLAGPDRPLADGGTISIIGPGTGLGIAHLWRSGSTNRVQATEGGHIGFAPFDRVEDAILARLRKRYGRVSAERVVSGPGILDIYQTLALMKGRAVVQPDEIDIWTKGISGEDSLAVAAVNRFCLCLGSVAGDIALAQGGFGGVVIAGGLGLRLRDILLGSGFAERFCAKGRFSGLMASVPVKLIIHPQPGLIGAAAAFAREHL